MPESALPPEAGELSLKIAPDGGDFKPAPHVLGKLALSSLSDLADINRVVKKTVKKQL